MAGPISGRRYIVSAGGGGGGGTIINIPDVIGLVEALAGKVDKVDGKGLSTEDFTTELRTKLVNLVAAEGIYTEDSPTLQFSGDGTEANPLVATVVGGGGGGSIDLGPTTSIELSGSGTPEDPILISARIGPQADNALTASPTGLYVPALSWATTGW